MRNDRGTHVPTKKAPNLGENWNLRNCGTNFLTYTLYMREKNIFPAVKTIFSRAYGKSWFFVPQFRTHQKTPILLGKSVGTTCSAHVPHVPQMEGK